MEICIKIQYGVPYFTKEAKSLLKCAVRENGRTMVLRIQLPAFWTLSIVVFFYLKCFENRTLSPSSGKRLLNWANRASA